MQAVEVNATVPNDQEQVKKPKKHELECGKSDFMDMLNKLMADSESTNDEITTCEPEKMEKNSEKLSDKAKKDVNEGKTESKRFAKDGRQKSEKDYSSEVVVKTDIEQGNNHVKNIGELSVNVEEEFHFETFLENVVDESEKLSLVPDADVREAVGDKKKSRNEKGNKDLQGIAVDVSQLKLAKKDSKTAKISDLDVNQASRAKKKTNKPVFVVEDLRTADVVENANAGVHTSGVEERTSTVSTNVDLTLSLNKSNGAADSVIFGGNSGNGVETRESNAPASFTQMLSQEIHNMQEDFVRAGKIVLRDNNTGSIKLTLQPEKLGNVKIFLELSEGNKVNGKITVASQEAYSAFKENLGELVASFENGGFDGAGFDLNWSGSSDNRGFDQGFMFGQSSAYEGFDDSLMVSADFAENRGYGIGQAETVDVLV